MQKAAADWPYSLPLFLPQAPVAEGDRVQQWGIKHLEELTQHGFRAAASSHILPGNTVMACLKGELSHTVHINQQQPI